MSEAEIRGMSDGEMDEINAELRRRFNSEAGLCMLMSEEVLSREWDTPEEDEAWKNL